MTSMLLFCIYFIVILTPLVTGANRAYVCMLVHVIGMC